MGTSATIGGVSFAALAGVAGRYLLFCSPETPRYDNVIYHPKGTTGLLVVEGGEAGRRIRCRVRYIEALATAEANKKSDEAAWENTDITIAYGGTNYLRCMLEADGRKVREPVAMGRGSLVFMDWEVTFLNCGGTS